jgi:hypothetical protein
MKDKQEEAITNNCCDGLQPDGFVNEKFNNFPSMPTKGTS